MGLKAYKEPMGPGNRYIVSTKTPTNDHALSVDIDLSLNTGWRVLKDAMARRCIIRARERTVHMMVLIQEPDAGIYQLAAINNTIERRVVCRYRVTYVL
jgi:hypothetical protein